MKFQCWLKTFLYLIFLKKQKKTGSYYLMSLYLKSLAISNIRGKIFELNAAPKTNYYFEFNNITLTDITCTGNAIFKADSVERTKFDNIKISDSSAIYGGFYLSESSVEMENIEITSMTSKTNNCGYF